MSTTQSTDQPTRVLDVRPMRKPDKHPAIFAAYRALAVGESFTLLNDHDPRHLREEFEVDHPGSYGWEYVSRESRAWRIKITKRASTPLPRVLVNTRDLPEETAAAGAVWKLETRERDLDANIIALPPGGTIGTHTGPDLDVLVHVLGGDGVLVTELGDQPLSVGALVFLPRRSLRGFEAGPSGLRYLTVHHKRKALVLEAPSASGRN
ncbi:DUF2249 domain-containing protein [Allokutzneria oryzae]|uniref:DUF2249 domain-containing protein n=1 Tax=Allokutzneria oryzae TaxID=1378989 RepID=A0ABV6ACM4_9PSEU